MDFLDPALQAYSERFTSPENAVLAELNLSGGMIIGAELSGDLLYIRMTDFAPHLIGQIHGKRVAGGKIVVLT